MNDDESVKNPDLKKGDFITVVRWTSCKDNSYRGDILRVLVVDQPFIVVDRPYEAAKFLRGKINLDTNQVEIKSLTQEYVDCLSGGDSKPKLIGLKPLNKIW